MKKFVIFAVGLMLVLASSKLYAQKAGEVWTLKNVRLLEQKVDEKTESTIPAEDKIALQQFMGPEKLTFLSADKLSYKRTTEEAPEVYSYTVTGGKLVVELSECKLTFDVKQEDDGNMSLTERHEQRTMQGETRLVVITYSYTK